jgi:hypothetical protein
VLAQWQGNGILTCVLKSPGPEIPEDAGSVEYDARQCEGQYSREQKNAHVLCPPRPFAFVVRPTLNGKIEKRKCAKKKSGLLHQEGDAKRDARPEKERCALRFFGSQEWDNADERRQHDEVSGVRRQSKYDLMGGE